MIKNNKWKLLISSILILLPIVVGLIFWNDLPAQMATHWGVDGEADGTAGRIFAVFGLPLILLAFHWFCVLITSFDKQNQGRNRKVQGLVLGIIPVISWLVSGLIYATAFGYTPDMKLVGALLLGVLFLVIGNYLPKCQQNHTIGIKMKWTLCSEENWNATHRFAGRVWMIGGVVMLFLVFLPTEIFAWAMLALVLVMVMMPAVYSSLYWRRQAKAGKVPKKAVMPLGKGGKVAVGLSLVAVTVIVLLVLIISFTGEITVEYGEESFCVSATYTDRTQVDYDEITDLSLVETHDVGIRVYGFASFHLELGHFQSEELGDYTRYAYGGKEQAVIVTCGERTLVIAIGDEGETKAVYETLLERIEY